MSSSSSRPTSVRGLYSEYELESQGEAYESGVDDFTAPPSEEWVFLPPTVSPPASHAPPAPSHLPTPSALMPDDDDASTVYGPIQLFAAEYFSTALGMPFEVGKTLLQIEYRPRRRFDPTPEDEKTEYQPEEEEVGAHHEIGSGLQARLIGLILSAARQSRRCRHVLHRPPLGPIFLFRTTSSAGDA